MDRSMDFSMDRSMDLCICASFILSHAVAVLMCSDEP